MTLREIAAVFDQNLVFQFHWINEKPASVRARLRVDSLDVAMAIRAVFPTAPKQMRVNVKNGKTYYWLNYYGKTVYRIVAEAGVYMDAQAEQVNVLVEWGETKKGSRRMRNSGQSGEARKVLIERLRVANRNFWKNKFNDYDNTAEDSVD